jgi:hypothetical protein
MSDVKKILSEREKTHGSFADVAAMSQQLKTAMSMSKNWLVLNVAQREALEYIAMKMARILSGDRNYRDHWQDIGGYAKLGEEWSNTSLHTVQKDLEEAGMPTVGEINFVGAEGKEEKAPVLAIFKK